MNFNLRRCFHDLIQYRQKTLRRLILVKGLDTSSERAGALRPGASCHPIVMWFSTDLTPGADQAAHPTVLRSCQS